jgi:trimeric autotransporter adhesin
MAVANDRAGALGATSNDLEQAGLIFNDAVRLSDGGLWSQPGDDHNQLNYASMYEADISILQQDIASAIANGVTVNGVAVTPSNANTLVEIQGQLAQMAQAAPNAVGTSDVATQAQGVLHANQQLIMGEIAGDANLQQALAANGVTNDGTGAVDQGFQAVPAHAADDAAALAAATAGANLLDVGTVFNAAANLSNGGLNAGNITQFDNDMKAVAAGLQNFINNGGLAAAQADTASEQALATAEGITLAQAQALTGVHVQTMLDQVQDQINRFDTMYATNPNIAARSTNDNLLDIIDIVQGDQALAVSAGNATGNASHDGGFAEQPGYLAGTVTHYQDNQAQTDFWSAFVAGANNLNNALTAEANGTVHLDAAGLNSLIQQVNGYQELGNSFDAAQGGIFGARFDNELLGGTLTADTSTALAALQDIANNGGKVSDADAAKLVASGLGYVADANDVSGNNIPNGGGTYVGTSTTVAGATTTHIADANTVTTGNVDGNEHATATPASPMNNGFGVTFPAPADAGGGGGAGGAGGTSGGAGSGSTGASGDQGHPGDDQSGNSGGLLSGNVATDLASLIQALQSGNKTAINAALTSLEGDINRNSGSSGNNSSNGSHPGDNSGQGAHNSCGGCGDDDGVSAAHHQPQHHHFEMIWHHA